MSAAALAAPERGRRAIVWLVMIVYLLLIFEGAIRKWVAPSMGQALFFIRDPFVLAIYCIALRHGFFPKQNNFLLAGLALGVLGLLLAGAQLMAHRGSLGTVLLLAGYGWRNYFFYIPLTFVVATALQREDIVRIVKLTLFLAVPMAALVLLQFASPLTSPINVGIGDEMGQQFHGLTVNQFHTRPMGTFTSDVGEKEFVVSCLAMALSLWIAPAARRYVKFWMLLPCTGGVLTCLALSGSRGAMLASGIVMLAAVGCAVLIRGGSVSARALLWPAVICVTAVVLYPIVFPEGYTSFMTRWTQAAVSEHRSFEYGILGRALYGFYDFFQLMGQAPPLGYGLGLAGNASLILGVTIEGFEGWAETDWSRHIVDLGPVLGVVFILFRIALVTWLASTCIAGARRIGDPLPILLLAYVSVELLYGQVTGHGTINGYAWLFAGLCLAASNARSKTFAKESAPEPIAVRPRFANLMR